MGMASEQRQFTVLMRILHWLMAAMVLTMLGIGVAMVASLGDYHRLVSIHRPLGIAILILVVIRFVNRQFSTLPPFPATMSSRERLAAHCVRDTAVHAVVRAAADRVGNVIGGALSDRAVWAAASSPDSSAQRDVVRVSEKDSHRSRLPLVPGVYRPFWSDFVSHARRARWIVQPHGAVENSRALGEFFTAARTRILPILFSTVLASPLAA